MDTGSNVIIVCQDILKQCGRAIPQCIQPTASLLRTFQCNVHQTDINSAGILTRTLLHVLFVDVTVGTCNNGVDMK